MIKKSQIKIYPDHTLEISQKNNRIEQSEAYNFVDFSQIPEYRNTNIELLKTAIQFLGNDNSSIIHVDNATGTGLIPQLASEIYQSFKMKATIIGIDPDLYALERGAESIQTSKNIQVLLFQGYGQNLQEVLQGHIPTGGVDMVSIHDAIHEIPGRDIKRAIFASQAKILKPGGVQTYNSAFTSIGMGEAAMQYGRWKLNAFSLLKQNRNRNIQAIEVYTPETYAQMITDSGLEIIHNKIKKVIMSREALEAISRYPEFVNGVFRDMEHESEYSLMKKSDALISALDKEKIAALPRLWHEIIAQKPKK
jgi:ubiquinone/menaquinone biosynthesis C-methylase UbiE